MPFTPSHVIAILPFARTPLAPAALALGSMAPDLPYFAPLGIGRTFTHSLAGVPTIDLAIGLVVFAAWLLVLRAPVLDYSPGWLRERMAPQARWRVGGVVISVLLVIAALELGILTHLLLDLFTHQGGWFETVAPWMATRIGGFAVTNVVHAVVSLLAAIGIAWWVRRWVQRTPRVQRPSRLRPVERRVTWVALAAVLAIVGLFWVVRNVVTGRNTLENELLFVSFCVAAGVTGAVALVLALVWHARRA